MIKLFETSAAGSLLLAAALVVSGCSSADREAGEGEPAAATQALNEESPTQGQDASAPIAAESSQTALNLRDEEKDFLAAVDAPQEVYQGAVLEAGYEACLRIEHTADADESALRSALAEGQIPDAEAAIRNLCPEFEKFLPDGNGS